MAGNQATTWTKSNNMQHNTDKTKEMSVYFGKKELDLDPITLDESEITCAAEFKLLVFMINNQLTLVNHVDYIYGKALCMIYLLCVLRRAAKPPNYTVPLFSAQSSDQY